MLEKRQASDALTLTGAGRAALNVLLYLLRSALALLLLGCWIKRLHSPYITIRNGVGLMDVVAQLDLFHDMSYAVLPAALIMLFAPKVRTRPLPRWLLTLALPTALALSLGLAWLPWRVGQGYWPQTAALNGSNKAAAYLALNLFVMLWFHVLHQWGRAWQILIARVPVLADLLVPALVWSTGRARNGRWFDPLRVFPAMLACAAVFLPWVLCPQPLESIDPAQDRFGQAPLRRLAEPPVYQVFVHPHNNTLLVTTAEHSLYLLDRATGAKLADLMTEFRNLQIVAYDPAVEEYVYVDPVVGRTLVLDASTLQVKREIEISNPIPSYAGNQQMTLMPAGPDTLTVYCQIGIARIAPQGDRIIASHNYNSLLSSMEYDSRRGTFHVPLWAPGALVELDGATLWVGRRLAIPNFAERTALDERTDRMYVAIPLRGELLAIDLDKYAIVDVVDSFPGLRLVTLDRAGRRMVISGFSPVIEVRSLDDYSLIDRIPGPPWARWMDIDERSGMLYVTSRPYGLYELDLDALGGDSWAARWRRIDPFYPAVNLLARLITRLLGWT